MRWSVTRGLESNLTSWPIQGWRPPDADTAIRPLRVDGWPAPTATLFILLKRSGQLLVYACLPQKGKYSCSKQQCRAGIPEPGTGQFTRNREPRPGKRGSCQPVVLTGRVGSNPTPGANLTVRASQVLSSVCRMPLSARIFVLLSCEYTRLEDSLPRFSGKCRILRMMSRKTRIH